MKLFATMDRISFSVKRLTLSVSKFPVLTTPNGKSTLPQGILIEYNPEHDEERIRLFNAREIY